MGRCHLFLVVCALIWLDKLRSARVTLFPDMHKPTQDSFIQPDASRRNFLRDTALASALVMTRPVDAIPGAVPKAMPEDGSSALPPAFSALQPLAARIPPIATSEDHERLLHAQKMMAELAPK